MSEEWRQHPLCPTYWFSSLGGIENRTDGTARRLKGMPVGRYRAIQMCPDSRTRIRRYVHRTICELFIGPPPFDGAVCRHLDTDSTNNAASNLAWGTVRENIWDGMHTGKIKRGEDNPGSKLTRAKVAEMRRIRAETGAPYSQIAAKFGVTRRTAARAITGKHWNETLPLIAPGGRT